jgi:hypothetical protein
MQAGWLHQVPTYNPTYIHVRSDVQMSRVLLVLTQFHKLPLELVFDRSLFDLLDRQLSLLDTLRATIDLLFQLITVLLST